MADQIMDKRTVAIPGPVGDVTPQARQARADAVKARDEAEVFAAQSGVKADTALAGLIVQKGSRTQDALLAWHGGLVTPRTILVGVGDSYMAGFRTSAPSTMSMTRRCADVLGLECRNYAVSGSGMLGGSGDRFSKQLDTAAADLKDSLDRVAVVLIGGGRNDGGVSGQASYQETIRATLQHAVDLFPGAKVVFVPAMWDSSWPSNELRRVYDRSMRAAVQVPQVQTVRGAWSWGIADPGYVDIHPGDALADTFGRLVASAVLHGGDTMWRDRELRLVAGTDNVTWAGGSAVLTSGVLHARIRACRPQHNSGAKLLFWIDNASRLGVWTTFTGMSDDYLVWEGKWDGRDFTWVGDIFGASNDGKFYNAQFEYNPLTAV